MTGLPGMCVKDTVVLLSEVERVGRGKERGRESERRKKVCVKCNRVVIFM